MATIDSLLQIASKDGFETLVLVPGERPRFRRNGSEVLGSQPLGKAVLERLLAEVAPPHLRLDREGEEQRFDYRVNGGTYRFTLSAAEAGPTVVVAVGDGDGARILPLPRRTPGPSVAPGRAASVEELLRLMVARGASDLHLSSGEPPRLRVDGDLNALDGHPALEPQQMHI